jgi:hypothetical protein
MRNELNKTYNLGGCSVGIAGGNDLRSTPLRWPQKADIVIPSFIMIDSGIQVILRVLQGAAPYLKRLVAGFPPRRPGFKPGSSHVEFVVDKVALE